LVEVGGAFIAGHFGGRALLRRRAPPGVLRWSRPVKHGCEISGAEPPVERGRRLVVAGLEAPQAVSQRLEVGEVGGLDDLTLDDREDDLDLVEPRGVNREMHEPSARPRLGHPVNGSLPVVGRPVVNDPVDSAGRCVGLGRHHLGHQLHERHDPGLGGDRADQAGPVDVVGAHVGQRPATLVLELDRAIWPEPGGRP